LGELAGEGVGGVLGVGVLEHASSHRASASKDGSERTGIKA
jgi:hypothetical protein